MHDNRSRAIESLRDDDSSVAPVQVCNLNPVSVGVCPVELPVDPVECDPTWSAKVVCYKHTLVGALGRREREGGCGIWSI